MEKEKEEMDRCFKKEKDAKEEYFKRANIMEKRSIEASAELIVHRERSKKHEDAVKKLERRLRETEREKDDGRERLENEIS